MKMTHDERHDAPASTSSAPSIPQRDSGIVDVRSLGESQPLATLPWLEARPRARGGLSLGHVALVLGLLASFASTAMASRMIYLAHRSEPVIVPAPAPIDVAPPAPVEPTEVPVAAAATTPENIPDEHPPPVLAPETARAATSTPARRAASKPKAPADEPAATSPSSGASLSLDDLMARATTPEPEAATPRATPAPALPDVPARTDVSRALSALASRVGACSEEAGTAMVRFAFDGPTGTVRSATVTGELSGSATATCVERAVTGVTLPSFARSPFIVTYPYRL
jgi:hypothetical protein